VIFLPLFFDIEPDPLGERKLCSEIDGVGSATHIRLPRVRPGFAAAASPSAGRSEPTRLPRCLTPFTYGMALVIRNFGMVCVLCHCKGAEPEPANKKPFRSGRKDFGIGSHLACADARYPTPPDLMRSRRDIRAIASKIKDDMYFIYGRARYWRNPFCDLILLCQKGVSAGLHVSIWPMAEARAAARRVRLPR
jgi:hypothetical protein